MSIKPPQRSLRFLTIFAYLVTSLYLPVFAQEYGFDTWTTANGLPQNTVTGVVQTPDGYLWLSTFDGLARFDGVRFTIFDKGNTKGIVGNRFSGIFADKAGAIWAMTENGVVTVYRDNAFASYQFPETLGSQFTIVSDANKNAIIETTSGFYYLQDGKFVRASDQNGKFYYGKLGAKWSFAKNGILREKDGQTAKYAIALPPEILNQFVSLLVHEDNRGALWIKLKDRLYQLADGTVTEFTKNEVTAFNELTPQQIFDDADGSVWIVFGDLTFTPKANAKLLRYKDNRFTAYNLNESVGGITGITDREGNYWLATSTGLRRLRQQIITSLSVKDGLNRDEVYPLLETSNGDVLIGTVQGVNRYREGKITDLGLKYSAGFPLYMRGLWEDEQKRVWLGYQGEGGFGRSEESSSVKRIGKNDIPNGATDFASDSEGNVWIATEEGLFKYRDDTEIAHYTTKNGLQNDKIITLHFDRNDNLWLGTFDGLSQFKDGKFTYFGEFENSPKGFVRAIYEDAEGVMWFGTYGDGLVRYKEGKFFNYRVEDGLFNNGVFAILEDGHRNFWMSSNRGIHRVSKQELNDFADGKIPKLNSVSYDEKDGMLNAECNGGRMPAAIKTKDGKFWFATMGGVAIIDPEAENVNPNPPPVVIENISIDRKSAIRNPNSAIELSPGQTQLDIEFTGLSLVKSAQIKFRYRLEGFDENWVEAGTKRTANYSYLPAGNYTFHVIAANANGVWNTEGAIIKIIVRPYFYQTWWFIGLCALALGGIVWLIYHNRISHLREIAETKTKFSRQLIESQEAERKRIAAELHDGLGQSLLVIKTRTTLGKKVSPDNEKMLGQFEEISKATGQALNEVRSIAYNLRPYHLERLGLRESIEAMLEKIREATNLEIKAHIALFDEVFSKDDEVTFYRIIQESLNNIIKHSEATTAEISIVQNEKGVTARISDNGRGFNSISANQPKGFGLIGMSERIRMLGGMHTVESEIGKGTKITINIPLREEKDGQY